MGERASDSGRGDQEGGSREGKNPFGGLLDNVKSIYGKAKEEVQNIDTRKIGDAVGAAGQQIGRGAERIGAGELGNQARDLGSAAQRSIKGQGTQADRDKLIGAGVEAGKLMMGGGTLTVADQLMKHGVIPGGKGGFNLGSLGGIFRRGAEEITRVDTLGFTKAVRENWDTLDADKNGYISREETVHAANDKIFALKNAHVLSVLDTMNDTLANCQNDEFGSETKGVSKGDINALEKGKLEGTGFRGLSAAGDGALDATPLALLGGGGMAYLSRAQGAGKMMSRGGLVTAGLLSVGGIYGAVDYYGTRKESIEKVIGELK